MSSEPAEKRSKNPVTLGYWDIRGLAQAIRLLLKYTGTEFEDVRYCQGDGPNFSRKEWTSVKETLGLDFPNLPYMVDGNLKITQSNAILSHVGRKNDLCGNDEPEKATVCMLEGVLMDFRNGFVRLCYNQNMESMKDDYINDVRKSIKKFSDYLGNKPWLIGENITYVDFHFYELLDQHRLFEPDLFEGMDSLKAYMDRFEALPAIKDYMASPDFKASPVNSKVAKWIGDKRDSA